MKGAEADLSAATYQIFDESHTLGNALRWMIMKKCALLPSLSSVFNVCSDARCALLQPNGGVLRV
jgi:DNA-directed RNA polymerase subunit L